MALQTGRANGHTHHYRLGDRSTSMDGGHNHLILFGSTMTSVNQGHRHSLINTNTGIISMGGMR